MQHCTWWTGGDSPTQGRDPLTHHTQVVRGSQDTLGVLEEEGLSSLTLEKSQQERPRTLTRCHIEKEALPALRLGLIPLSHTKQAALGVPGGLRWSSVQLLISAQVVISAS